MKVSSVVFTAFAVALLIAVLPKNASAQSTVVVFAVKDEEDGLHYTPTSKVKAGDSVKWVNLTRERHTVSPITNADKLTGTANLKPIADDTDGDEYSEVMQAGAGTIHFQCGIHPEMTGTIEVTD